jgi:elongation factor P
MVVASELKEGVVIRIEGQIYRVLAVESKAGAAKLGGVVKTKLSNVRTGRVWEPHFRPLERLEGLEVERYNMEFIFREGDTCTFMRPDTFEQIQVPHALLGLAGKFMQPGMELPVEFFEGQPISVILSGVAEARVVDTAPPAHSQQDSAWKQATLENGVSIHVPLLIAPGEVVRVDLKTGHYIERARSEWKRGA